MKLSEWARQNGVSYKTAWLKKGLLPVPARQLPTGTILVDVEPTHPDEAVVYAHVGSEGDRADLDRQVARCAAFAAEQGLRVAKVVTEVGSGRLGLRAGLLEVLRTPAYRAVVVERRGHLAPFGTEYIEAALAAAGRRLLVADPEAGPADLEADMLELLTTFCAQRFGRRGARRRAERALRAAAEGA
jgi:putative resolvase